MRPAAAATIETPMLEAPAVKTGLVVEGPVEGEAYPPVGITAVPGAVCVSQGTLTVS